MKSGPCYKTRVDLSSPEHLLFANNAISRLTHLTVVYLDIYWMRWYRSLGKTFRLIIIMRWLINHFVS